MDEKKNITYSNLFWLFIFASWFGVIFEGFNCLIKNGRWESHVVSIFGHFCIIYGIGIVFYYVFAHLFKKINIFLKFFIYAGLGTFVELICGLILEYGLGMKAWSYANEFLNYKGYICLMAFIVWGVFGVIFESLIPRVQKLLNVFENKIFKFLLPFFTIFMIVNLSLTAVCIIRWSNRHYGVKPSNKFERYIDKKYDDKYMSTRFMEWYFIDNK